MNHSSLHIAPLLVLSASLIATACQHDSSANGTTDEQVAITFGVSSVDRTTRADSSFVDSGENLLPTTDMEDQVERCVGVFGYYTGQSFWGTTLPADKAETPTFFYNQKMAIDPSADPDHPEYRSLTYSPMRLWPNTPNDKVSFWAYYPYAQTDLTDNMGISITSDIYDATDQTRNELGRIGFEMNSDVSKHVDLLVSDLVVDQTRADYHDSYYKVTAPIRFHMHHALAQVRIYVTADLYNPHTTDPDSVWYGYSPEQLTAGQVSESYQGLHLTQADIYSFTNTQISFDGICKAGTLVLTHEEPTVTSGGTFRQPYTQCDWRTDAGSVGEVSIGNYDYEQMYLKNENTEGHYTRSHLILAIPQILSDNNEPKIVAYVTRNEPDSKGHTVWARMTINLMEMGIKWEPGVVYSYAFRLSVKPGDDLVLGPEVITQPIAEDRWAVQW